MPEWQFEERDPRYVEQELTQRDQFNNDEVTLAEAIVREVIQNSTDAYAGSEPVKVRFHINVVATADLPEFRALFTGLKPHLQGCGIDIAVINQQTPRLLVIEDFNTRGLTGEIGALDGGNFHSFWRRHGKSGKSGRHGGRWGLGKLVYSSSSDIRAFFGLTVRSEESVPLVMGQAVLSNHDIDSRRYVAHGFWFSDRNADGMQLPISDTATIARISAMCGLTRTSQSGLSLVIPFVNANITHEVLIQGVIENYYFPILAGKLVVEVDGTIIDAKNFQDVAQKTAVAGSKAHPERFAFVSEVSGRLTVEPQFTAKHPEGAQTLSAALFDDGQIVEMKHVYGRGELLHVRLPVRLRTKGGEVKSTFADLFLKSPPENAKPFTLFARGSITVPAEQRYFNNAHAFGAFVGLEENIVAFLGDAENPAHTAWNGNAEKLNVNWRNPAQTLKNLRYALWGLYDLVSEQGQRDDPDALIDFFALTDMAKSQGAKKPRNQQPQPDIPPPAPKAFRIVKSGPGGFAIVPGPGAARWTYPKSIRVRVAYDMIGGNPFSKHSSFDFDLASRGIIIEKTNMSVFAVKANVLQLMVNNPEFRLEATGFDQNRDLVIDAKVSA